MTGDDGFERVNVADQRRDAGSLLRFVTTLARRYRECPELGWTGVEVLDQPHHAVLAHRWTKDDGGLVAVHDLGRETVTVPLPLTDCDSSVRLVDLLSDGVWRPDDRGSVEVPVDGYGYRWLRVVRPGDRRVA
ncbi:MAG: hypothetical protein M3Q27_08085 [Actinomycetota bacterium]|nr:hypothetical protein [Actinomycetota bacterium]